MCCPASSATIVASGGPFLGSNAITEAGGSPVWTRIIASFRKTQPCPSSQHNDPGPFLAETRQSASYFGKNCGRAATILPAIFVLSSERARCRLLTFDSSNEELFIEYIIVFECGC